MQYRSEDHNANVSNAPARLLYLHAKAPAGISTGRRQTVKGVGMAFPRTRAVSQKLWGRLATCAGLTTPLAGHHDLPHPQTTALYIFCENALIRWNGLERDHLNCRLLDGFQQQDRGIYGE